MHSVSSDFKSIQFESTSQLPEYELICIYDILALHEIADWTVYMPYMTAMTKTETLISKTLCRNYMERNFGHNVTRSTHLRHFSDTDTQQSWAKYKLETK